MVLYNEPSSMLRFVLVVLTGCVMTWNYYTFSHFVHKRHKHGGNFTHGNHTHAFEPTTAGNHTHGKLTHGGHNPFEGIYLKYDDYFLYGLALPLLLLTVVSLIWNPIAKTTILESPRPRIKRFFDSVSFVRRTQGDVNVQKWTIVCFVLPLLFILFDSAHEHFVGGRSNEKELMDWSWFNSVLTSFMSPTGYAAVWALAAFLIPVTKHSPILDWLHITPVQALAFHRVSGWTSLVFSILHGFLHLRHLMDVLRRGNPRPWYSELEILLIPPSWECIGTQNPVQVFFSEPRQTPIHSEDSRCWLALINATGMISVLSFLVLAISSLPRVRRSSYTLFYRLHVPLAWIMMVSAVWHYPTCALVLIPNILYYISFNLPVHVSRAIDSWSSSRRETKTSILTEANLIEGGVVELNFAAAPLDRQRHESRFVKLYHPLVSPVSHPFSVFSPQALKVNDSHGGNASLSIILRSSGPFTKRLTEELFTSQSSGTTSEMVQVDSFYASSFDWVDRAMLSHDEILLVAGGVGIVPFLEFLPALQRAIVRNTLNQNTVVDAATANHDLSLTVNNEALLDATGTDGDVVTTQSDAPSRIHLHWYCREVGLASYVWHKYLCDHIEQAWEGNNACRSRLTVHFHLTSLHRSSFSPAEILSRVPNAGLVQNRSYCSSENGGISIRPIQDAHTAQSWLLGLLVPGVVMIAAILLHWLWYKGIIVNDQFREDNLIIRSHSIVFTILLSLIVSIVVHGYLRWRQSRDFQHYTGVPANDLHVDNDINVTSQSPDSYQTPPVPTMPTITTSRGRPTPDSVASAIIKANNPGVYMCGPRPLMESIEGAVRHKSSGCAIYRHDSNM